MSNDVTVIHGDCLDVMSDIPDGSIDLILADLPYGTTACAWDVVIPFEPLWGMYRRVLKSKGTVVLTAAQPFTTDLINSNRRWFKYCLVWYKKKPANFQLAKFRPMTVHEDIVVFAPGSMTYNPIKTPRPILKRSRKTMNSGAAPLYFMDDKERSYSDYHPESIIEFSNANQVGRLVSTQKPVALMEYLVQTYSHPGETVLDNAMGSGTTGLACMRTGRRFIGIEKDADIFAMAYRRLDGPLMPLFDDMPDVAPDPTPLFAAMEAGDP